MSGSEDCSVCFTVVIKKILLVSHNYEILSHNYEKQDLYFLHHSSGNGLP